MIILAGIISYIDLNYDYYFFLRLISIYHFSIIFSNTKIINNTKLKTDKIDCQSYFGVMQSSFMHTLNIKTIVGFELTMTLKTQNDTI